MSAGSDVGLQQMIRWAVALLALLLPALTAASECTELQRAGQKCTKTNKLKASAAFKFAGWAGAATGFSVLPARKCYSPERFSANNSLSWPRRLGAATVACTARADCFGVQTRAALAANAAAACARDDRHQIAGCWTIAVDLCLTAMTGKQYCGMHSSKTTFRFKRKNGKMASMKVYAGTKQQVIVWNRCFVLRKNAIFGSGWTGKPRKELTSEQLMAKSISGCSARTCGQIRWRHRAEKGDPLVCGATPKKWSVQTKKRNLCHDAMTFKAAKRECAAKGARLCTLDEQNEGAGTGCMFDGVRIWTATACGPASVWTQAGTSSHNKALNKASIGLGRQCTPTDTAVSNYAPIFTRCCADVLQTMVGCTLCPPGKSSKNGITDCRACPAGKYREPFVTRTYKDYSALRGPNGPYRKFGCISCPAGKTTHGRQKERASACFVPTTTVWRKKAKAAALGSLSRSTWDTWHGRLRRCNAKLSATILLCQVERNRIKAGAGQSSCPPKDRGRTRMGCKCKSTWWLHGVAKCGCAPSATLSGVPWCKVEADSCPGMDAYGRPISSSLERRLPDGSGAVESWDTCNVTNSEHPADPPQAMPDFHGLCRQERCAEHLLAYHDRCDGLRKATATSSSVPWPEQREFEANGVGPVWLAPREVSTALGKQVGTCKTTAFDSQRPQRAAYVPRPGSTNLQLSVSVKWDTISPFSDLDRDTLLQLLMGLLDVSREFVLSPTLIKGKAEHTVRFGLILTCDQARDTHCPCTTPWYNNGGKAILGKLRPMGAASIDVAKEVHVAGPAAALAAAAAPRREPRSLAVAVWLLVGAGAGFCAFAVLGLLGGSRHLKRRVEQMHGGVVGPAVVSQALPMHAGGVLSDEAPLGPPVDHLHLHGAAAEQPPRADTGSPAIQHQHMHYHVSEPPATVHAQAVPGDEATQQQTAKRVRTSSQALDETSLGKPPQARSRPLGDDTAASAKPPSPAVSISSTDPSEPFRTSDDDDTDSRGSRSPSPAGMPRLPGASDSHDGFTSSGDDADAQAAKDGPPAVQWPSSAPDAWPATAVAATTGADEVPLQMLTEDPAHGFGTAEEAMQGPLVAAICADTRGGGGLGPQSDRAADDVASRRCPVEGCDFVAQKRSHIPAHMRMRGGKPHVCPEAGCDYSTAYKGHLSRHMRTHNGVRPYVCSWAGCDYRARQHAHLTAHMMKHTKDKPFRCPGQGCRYSAPSKWHLERHFNSKHKAEGKMPEPIVTPASEWTLPRVSSLPNLAPPSAPAGMPRVASLGSFRQLETAGPWLGDGAGAGYAPGMEGMGAPMLSSAFDDDEPGAGVWAGGLLPAVEQLQGAALWGIEPPVQQPILPALMLPSLEAEPPAL